MIDKNLFEKGKEALDQGDYFEALGLFLRLREKKLDLVNTWDIEGGLRKLQICDVNFDHAEEVGALSKEGRFSILSLHCTDNPYELPDHIYCQSFCFYESKKRKRIVIAEKQNEQDLLWIYEVESIGQNNRLRINRIGEPRSIDNKGRVLDIAFKNNRIFVTTTDQKIYQYNGISFVQDSIHKIDRTIKRLYTGGKGSEFNNRMHDRLLGLSNDGTLVLYDIGFEGFREINTISEEVSFIDAFIIDFDNDGTEDIITCSQNGRIFVYDMDTLRLKHEFRCFDEFHSISCADIDDDQNIEILVGAKSNYIYVLGINPNHELRIKWKYKTEHQVWALSIGKIREKELSAELANGKLQIYKIFSPAKINQKVSIAYKGLLRNTKNEELFQLLSQSSQPEMVKFALDGFVRNMKCSEVIDFLKNIEKTGDYESKMQILPKLKVFLDKYPNDFDLINYIKVFLERLFDQNPDLLTSERICNTLDEIVRYYPEKMLQLSEKFKKELHLRKVRKPGRIKLIEELISKENLIAANHELEELSQYRVDLLKSFQGMDGIKDIYYSENEHKVVLTTNNRSIRIIDTDKGKEIKCLSFKECDLHYYPIFYSSYRHLIFHGETAEFYDDNYHSQKSISYDSIIQCAEIISYEDELCWIIGLRNGRIIIDGLSRNKKESTVSTYPIKIIKQIRQDHINIWFITQDCKIYALRDVLNIIFNDTETIRLSLEFDLDDYINVLDFIAIDDRSDDTQFILLSDHNLYFIRRANGNFQKKEIKVNIPLSCINLFDYDYNGIKEIMLGTRHRSLLPISLDGKIQKEIYLPYIPISLFSTKSMEGDSEVLIGFYQGALHHYRFIPQDRIKELKKKCGKQKQKQFIDAWQGCDFREKLVLIAISKKKRLDIKGIYTELDSKIRPLVPKKELVKGIKSMKEKGIIQESVKRPQLYYSFLDEEYSEWVNLNQDEFKALRGHRDEIIDSIKLIDIWNINEVLRKQNAIEWLFDFMLMDPHKWDDLVSLSEFINKIKESSGKERETLSQKYLNFICSKIQCRISRIRLRKRKKTSIFSPFELYIPLIKFQGFDRIQVLLVERGESNATETILRWIKEGTPPRIVLILTSSEKEFLINSFKNESFNTAILDEDDLKDIFLSRDCREEFLSRLIDQINIAALSPYQVAGPVTDMFYGRENERQIIMNSFLSPNAKSFAVIGPRRIGKTSLLLKIKEEIKYKTGFQGIFLDAMPHGRNIHRLYEAILYRLNIQQKCSEINNFVSSIDNYCREKGCRLVLFLDEVDDFLKTDEKNDYIFFKTLRALINENNVKLLISGYKTLYFQMKDRNSPLFNMLEPIELSCLDKRSAVSLIKEPVQNIFQINSDGIEHILEKTGCYPNFIQFCCQKLVETKRASKTRAIPISEIEKVVSSREFYDFVIDVYLKNLDKESKTVLYLMLCHFDYRFDKFRSDHTGFRESMISRYVKKERNYELGKTFTPYHIHGLLETYNIYLSNPDLETVMEELVLAAILKSGGGKEYSFIMHDLPEILREHVEIEECTINLLEEAKEIFKNKG